ncbi:MAG: NADH-quinone oxidoreductase subunit C, partial [Candidatus Omnitrophica bacterium]|nr:NADH-quinone oxidoreductase subunit C [Candidatus Omnitrophota bacterium]
MMFALDEREKSGNFLIKCVFVNIKKSQWITITMAVPEQEACFESLSKSLYSANLFEREINEMFGIEAKGSPDLRRLNLHDEVWPAGNYPLRKDFKKMQPGNTQEYRFSKVDGEGIFEVPVGPVHAGIIGPGHFRFSAAGEPIINLETRLGFTHRGVEKIFEGKDFVFGLRLAECVTGDSCFAHSLAFTHALEKICKTEVPKNTVYLRAIFLELERMYNHVSDIGGMATDVG